MPILYTQAAQNPNTVPIAEIKKRPLGRTGLFVSEIGFGGWGIGKDVWKQTSDGESMRALRQALDRGINYFDTALSYGGGHSEKLIGRLARASKQDIIISTKIPPKNKCRFAEGIPPLSEAFPPQWIVRCVEQSLRNLSVGCLTIEKFHTWTDEWLADALWPEVAQTLERLKKEGKIRFFGVSIRNGNPQSALKLAASGLADEIQAVFNIFEPDAADALLPLCRRKGVALVARSPFDEGALTGELTPQTKFEPGDFRRQYFEGIRLLEAWRRARLIATSANGHKARDLAAIALKFCLSFPGIATVIPGMRKVRHVIQNTSFADGHYYTKKELGVFTPHRWPATAASSIPWR